MEKLSQIENGASNQRSWVEKKTMSQIRRGDSNHINIEEPTQKYDEHGYVIFIQRQCSKWSVFSISDEGVYVAIT